MKLSERTFASGITMTMSSFGVQLGRIVTLIILARLLEPSDFGVYALGAVLIRGCALVSKMGMEQAIVAVKGDAATAGFHGMVITTIVAMLVTLGFLASGGPLASVFDQERLAAVCRIMAVAIVLDTWFVMPSAILTKDMLFGRLIIANTLGPFLSMSLGITMAFMGFGIWSLAALPIAEAAAKLLIVLVVSPDRRWLRPHRWSGRLAAALVRFGLAITGAGVVRYVYREGDKLVVGKLFGAATLGFYSQAFRLAIAPLEGITTVTNSVLLSAYTKVRDDRQRLAAAFVNSLQLLAVLTIPMGVGILVLAPELVILLLGEKWRSAIPLLQIFACLGIFAPLSGTMGPLFSAVLKPHFTFRTTLVHAVAMVLFAVLLVPFLGAAGMAAAVVSAIGIGLVYNVYQACWRSGAPIRLLDLLQCVWPPAFAAAMMAGVVVALKHLLLTLGSGRFDAGTLLLLVVAGVLSYAGFLCAVKPRLVRRILRLTNVVFREHGFTAF